MFMINSMKKNGISWLARPGWYTYFLASQDGMVHVSMIKSMKKNGISWLARPGSYTYFLASQDGIVHVFIDSPYKIYMCSINFSKF
jgi:hypothetical protein